MNEQDQQPIEESTPAQEAITDDQMDFVKALEDQEAIENGEPDQAQAEEATQAKQIEVDSQTAKLTATGGLELIEFALKRFIHREFSFTAETKVYAVENLSPVLIKYGALIPAWVAIYEEEIKAVTAVGKLVGEGIDTAKTLKAKDAAIEAARKAQSQAQEAPQEKERVRVAA